MKASVSRVFCSTSCALPEPVAGLGLAVVNALRESSWGTFTIAMTIPVALFVGLWMYRIRKGKIAEASILGVIGIFAALIIGGKIPGGGHHVRPRPAAPLN